MIDRPVTLHVGFSKTATTSLQNSVFATLPGVANLGKPFLEQGRRKPLYDAIVHLTFSEELAYDAAATARAFSEAVNSAAGRVLISSEGFSYGRHNDPALVARRLRAIFSNASVIFTVREQVGWIRSLYLDDCGRFVFEHPVSRFETWLALERRKRNRNALRMANFEPLIAFYEQLFGRERVHVLLYEEMLAAPGRFSDKLAGALGIEATILQRSLQTLPRSNTALSQRAYRFGLFNHYFLPPVLRRYVARLPNFMRARILRGSAPKLSLAPQSVELIRGYVRTGNRALAARHALDLAAHGYAM